MPFAVTTEHRTFFEKNHYIGFEELIPPAQAARIKQDAEQAVCKKLGIPSHRITEETSLQLFQAGYHLHLTQESIKRITHKTSVATIVAELTLQPSIRFGFDQYILITHGLTPPFPDAPSLQQTSCLSPLAAALILPLQDLEAPLDCFPMMPQKLGDALFISPTLPIPWSKLFAVEGLCFLLIGYAQEKTFFKAETPDPLAKELKKLGIAFNDLIKHPLHPLLKRL